MVSSEDPETFTLAGTTPKVDRGPGYPIALSPTSTVLAEFAGHKESKLRLINYETQRIQGHFPVGTSLKTLLFSPDGKKLLALDGRLLICRQPWTARSWFREELPKGALHGAWLDNEKVLIAGSEEKSFNVWFAVVDARPKKRNRVKIIEQELPDSSFDGKGIFIDAIVNAFVTPSALIGFVGIYSIGRDYRSLVFFYQFDERSCAVRLEDRLPVDDPDVRVVISDSGHTMLLICGRREHSIMLVDRKGDKLDGTPFTSEYGDHWITFRDDTLLHRRGNIATVLRIADGKLHNWLTLRVPNSRYPKPSLPERNVCVGYGDLVQLNGDTYLALEESGGGEIKVYRLVDFDLVQLYSKDILERSRAANSIGSRRYRPAVPKLISLISDSDPAVRNAVIGAISEIGDPSALTEMIAALGVESDADTATRLLDSILVFPEGGVAAAISECLNKDEAATRLGAVRTLECLKPESPDSLVRALADRETQVRVAAARALGNPNHQRAIPALIKVLEEEQDTVASAVAESLARIGNPIAVPSLIRRLGKATNADLRSTILEALSRFPTDKVESAIVQSLRHPGPHRSGAALILSLAPVPETFDGLVRALADADADVRRHAASALGKTGLQIACVALLARLNDGNVEVEIAIQQAAIDLLNQRASATTAPRPLNAPIDLRSYTRQLIASGDVTASSVHGPAQSFLSDLISSCMDCVEFPALLNAIESVSQTASRSGKEVALASALIFAEALRKSSKHAEAIEAYTFAGALAEHLKAAGIAWRSLGAIADCFEVSGEDTQALESYRTAMQVIDREWLSLIEESKMRGFFADKAALYEKACICALRLGHWALSLEILEKSKTRYLGDLIARRQEAPRKALQEQLVESWGVGSQGSQLQLNMSNATSGENVQIVGAARAPGTAGDATICPRALAEFEEAIDTGRSQLTRGVVYPFWTVATDAAVEGKGDSREHLEEIYRIIDQIRMALEQGGGPLSDVELDVIRPQLSKAWSAVTLGKQAFVDTTYPLRFIDQLAGTITGDKEQFELALNAILEALNLVLHHEPVLGVPAASTSINQTDLVFLTASHETPATHSQPSSFVQTASQRSARSEWQYVSQVARGEISHFQDVLSGMRGDPETAQIEFAVTDRGTIAYVVHSKEGLPASNSLLPDLRGGDDLQVFTLPTVNLSELKRQLFVRPDSWFAGLHNVSHTAQSKPFQDSMDRVLLWLHSELIQPLIPHLKRKEVTKLRIIPHRGLHLVPFAAMHSADTNGNRRFIIDDYEIEYAPSATLLRICRERRREAGTSPSLTIVADPLGDLRFTGYEAEQVGNLFGNDQVQRAGNRAELLRTASQGFGSVFHFSGHGQYRFDDPMQSSLVLASGESLSLDDLFSETITFPQTKLVVLAACETSVVDPEDQADEYLGLASGFLFGGTRAVISTLWPVDDLSTALLMKEFYRIHLTERLPVVSALRRAQLWLRDSTVEQMGLVEYWQKSYEASGGRDVESFRKMRIYRANPQLRAFQHPYYWACFICSGVS